VLKACLNGGTSRVQSPYVPLTPAELAADAVRCRAAGAYAVHVHPRTDDGAESLDAETIGAAVEAIRRVAPGLPVGVSTGAWIAPDPAQRLAAVRSWATLPSAVRPDFASVNAHEEAAEDVATALYDGGIGVEAGLWTVAAVEAYRRWRVPCLRLLVELVDVAPHPAPQPAPHPAPHPAVQTGPHLAPQPAPQPALVTAAEILDTLGDEPSILLHAEGPATWTVLREAVRRGLDTRIGIEDTSMLPDGSMVDNVALVAHAVALGAC